MVVGLPVSLYLSMFPHFLLITMGLFLRAKRGRIERSDESLVPVCRNKIDRAPFKYDFPISVSTIIPYVNYEFDFIYVR
jgi:hypothetical protein